MNEVGQSAQIRYIRLDIRDFRDLLSRAKSVFRRKQPLGQVRDGGFRSITYSHFKNDVDVLAPH